MELRYVEIADAVLHVLKDAEFHTITATTFKVGSRLVKSEKEMTVRYDSRKKKSKYFCLKNKGLYASSTCGV